MQNERVLASMKYGDSTVEIIEIPHLKGSRDAITAQNVFFFKEAGASVKFVRVTLNEGVLRTESGAFYFSKGNIRNDVPIGGVGGIVAKNIKSKLTNETAFNPTYSGTGIVELEPSTGHYAMIPLNNETLIVDKGMYYCSVGNIDTSVAMQNTISSAMLGGDGFFQTKVTGTGIVVFDIPVPMEEIEVFHLNNETVQVDGNFAILRSASLNFTVERSSRTIVGSVVNGEGMLNKYSGTGMIWLAPTTLIYPKIARGRFSSIAPGHMNNRQ